ncbi:hypothetical protein V6Z11_A12G119500 [Gossypium hirsutum]
MLACLVEGNGYVITCLLQAYYTGPHKPTFGLIGYLITGLFHSRLKQRFLRISIHYLNNPLLPSPKFHLKNTLNRQPFPVVFDSGIPPLHPRALKKQSISTFSLKMS